MQQYRRFVFIVLGVACTAGFARVHAQLPVEVGAFSQHVHRAYPLGDDGAASEAVLVAVDDNDAPHALDVQGRAHSLADAVWALETDPGAKAALFPPSPDLASLPSSVPGPDAVRDVVRHGAETALAAEDGLFLSDGTSWRRALPQDGHVRWSPVDVRAVAYGADGTLWFAAPQGVGRRASDGAWRLFTGADGLPYNDFTCMATGPSGVWFGTTNGAIHFHDGQWSFRQGGRWLLDNHVNDIAVDDDGNAWIATPKGVSCIAMEETTLSAKADYYEDEIEAHHRRTRFGYVNPANLTAPGDKSTAVPTFSDNDGFNTGLYLAAMSFAFDATGEAHFQRKAVRAFDALAFLSEVTQGGSNPGPPGLIARNVIPTSGPDPNEHYGRDYDLRRNEADALWKIMEPRLPVDETGEWYWKADASSDELDGHLFGAAIYFDRVCATEAERDTVRVVVKRIMDHLLTHDLNLVDHDGAPTRWGRFSPDDLNRNYQWVVERGLNSYSILTYLTIAHHITGDATYREVFLDLAWNHGYAMNGMSQPKAHEGPRYAGHQPDDNMAFMNYYHLIRYETDPTLKNMFLHAIHEHWKYEEAERNVFTNFIYGACAEGETYTDQWGTDDVSPPLACYEDAVDTLKRYPMDLIEWPMSNAHRTDLVPMGEPGESPAKIGRRVDGYVFPIDERHETYWDWDPWRLSFNGDGMRLRPGFHYLLAYYLGRAHGFIAAP